MHDYLKDAADAASLSDDELRAINRDMRDPANPTDFEQAVLDEMERRHLQPAR
ncbi:hypothetical protein [Sphingobium chungbukense]|uniref:hypothetical protein n=1 Tax=Sphingobium chungbukense TaxID=56193 RepID=UPI000A912D45|nr:hypothetical protein [Sphingobium chungbukense]